MIELSIHIIMKLKLKFCLMIEENPEIYIASTCTFLIQNSKKKSTVNYFLLETKTVHILYSPIRENRVSVNYHFFETKIMYIFSGNFGNRRAYLLLILANNQKSNCQISKLSVINFLIF